MSESIEFTPETTGDEETAKLIAAISKARDLEYGIGDNSTKPYEQ